jgi:hypothetical protein
MERSTSLEYALCRHRRERVAGAANWRLFEAEVDLRAISEYTSAFWEHRMAPFS